jgi:hypothetical protein
MNTQNKRNFNLTNNTFKLLVQSGNKAGDNIYSCRNLYDTILNLVSRVVTYIPVNIFIYFFVETYICIYS